MLIVEILILGVLLLFFLFFLRTAKLFRRHLSEYQANTSENLAKLADTIEDQRLETRRALDELRRAVNQQARRTDDIVEKEAQEASRLSAEEIEQFFDDICIMHKDLGAGQFIPIERLATRYMEKRESDLTQFQHLLQAARSHFAERIEIERGTDGRALIRLTA